MQGPSQCGLSAPACLDRAFNLCKGFLTASAWGMVATWNLTGKSWGTPGGPPLQTNSHSGFPEHSHTFLGAIVHIVPLSILLHYLLLLAAAFGQKWHGNVHTGLEENKVMERQPLHCQKRKPGGETRSSHTPHSSYRATEARASLERKRQFQCLT